MSGYVGWWIIGAAGFLFAVFHGTLLLTVLVLRHVNWISEDSYRSIVVSLPIKVAEVALATLFAYMTLDWFKV